MATFQDAAKPELAVTGSGEIVATWLHVRSFNDAAVLAAHEADDFEPWSPTAPLVGRASDPHVAGGPGPEAVVVWRRSHGGEQFIETALHGEAGWRAHPGALNPPPGAGEPATTMGADGEVLVAWNQVVDAYTGVLTARLKPDATAFLAPNDSSDVLSPPINFTNDPELALNERGDAIVTWYQAAGDELMTFVSERRGSEGTFSRPGPGDVLSPLGAPVEDPVVDLAADGSAVVAWRQETGSDKSAIFLATRDARGHWSTPSSLEESFSEPVDAAWNVGVAMSDDGHLYLVWREDRGDDIAIVAAHRHADGEWLADGRAPIRLSGSTPSIDPVLAVGADDGHVVAAWTQLDDGGWKVIARRSSARLVARDEGDRWMPPQEISAAGSGDAGQPSLSIGGNQDRVALAFVQQGELAVATVD